AGLVLDGRGPQSGDGGGEEAVAWAGEELPGAGVVHGRRPVRPGGRPEGGGPAGVRGGGEPVRAFQFLCGGPQWSVVVAPPRLSCVEPGEAESADGVAQLLHRACRWQYGRPAVLRPEAN